jgi:type IV secretion system protein VirD4
MKARERAGWPILVYNPTNQGKYGSNSWSPLVAAMGERPWAGARRMAKTVIVAAELADGGANAKKDFWNATAADYLGPLLLAAATEGPSMEPVMRWLQEGGANDESGVEGGRMKGEVRARLANYPEALRAAEGVWRLHFKLRDSIYVTARTALTPYEDEEVSATCLPTSGQLPDITPDAVLGNSGANGEPARRGATLYIIAPATEGEYFAPLFSALVTSLIEAAYRRAGESGKLDPPLLLALDEVANITPIKDLPKYSSTAANEGIQLLTVLQDFGQAEHLWGEDGTRTLMTNHPGGRLIFGGTVDPPTLRWVEDMLGVIDRERVTSSQEGVFGRRSRTRSWERQPVATAAEIRTMPKGTALLISGSAPPARVTLRQWWTV